MKFNKLTMGLAAVGVVSLASAARADEMKMSQVQTALSNTTLSGYVDTAAQWNLGSQNGGNTPAYAFGAGKADGFNLNAIDIALDKPMDESPWAAGYRVEMMAGPDSVPGGTGLGIRQAYLALRTPVANSGIDWKIGVWDTIIGYESSSDPLNPNYTRSYGYTMEPTTHTGILGTYKVNDMVSLSAGVADGSSVTEPGYKQTWTIGPSPINGRDTMETKKAYMGAIALTAPDSWGWAKGATLNVGLINNDDGKNYNPGAMTDNFGTTSLYVGATVPTPLTALKVGAAWDYLEFHDAHHTPNANTDSSQWDVALYANYQYNDKLSFNARAEHLEYNVQQSNATYQGLNNSDELTLTTQYALWANVLSRVEFRWDHKDGGSKNPISSGGFDNSAYSLSGTGIHDNAFLLALNLIYQF